MLENEVNRGIAKREEWNGMEWRVRSINQSCHEPFQAATTVSQVFSRSLYHLNSAEPVESVQLAEITASDDDDDDDD